MNIKGATKEQEEPYLDHLDETDNLGLQKLKQSLSIKEIGSKTSS